MSLSRPTLLSLILGVGATPLLSAATLDDTLGELKESLIYGKPSVYLRYRYETVDQDNPLGAPPIDQDAHAATLRAAIGYETRPFHGLTIFGQYEGVFAHDTAYNDGDPLVSNAASGRNQYPVIGDPEGVELNQAWVRYAPSFVPRTALKAGRQEIVLDNARWVGNVAWRQNWQSFDAATITSSWLADTTLFYGYLEHVHRIAGDDHPTTGDFDLDKSHLLNLAYRFPEFGTLTGYAYLVDFEPGVVAAPAQAFANQSTQTLGARFAGAWKMTDKASALYTLEYATQSDYGDNTAVEVDADYLLGEVGASYANVALKVGYEVLGGSGDVGDKLSTPLATLHAHNGWADIFLATPDAGLIDLYVSLTGPIPITEPWLDSFRFGVMYHDFSSDADSIHYGEEFDVLLEYAVKKLDPNWILGVKYADFQADEAFLDTTKMWFYTQYSF